MEFGMSLEDYLESIFVLGSGERPVRLTDIARKLGVKKSSAVSALNKLQTEGLVLHERYGDVMLTQKGIEIASRIYKKHLTVYAFLSEILGIEDITANREACKIEHYISDRTAERLEMLIKFSRSCDRLNHLFKEEFRSFIERGVMPSLCENKEVKMLFLSELKEGERARVQRINCDLPVKSKLLAMGVVPGVEIKLEKIAPLGDPIDIVVKGYHLSLRREEAACIEVEKI